MYILHYLKNHFIVYLTVEKVQDVMLSSAAGVRILTVCLKEAGIPITIQDWVHISVVNDAARRSPVIL